jgi:L-ribulokinase
MGAVRHAAYIPRAAATAAYRELYDYYRELHDQFGRGGTDVMHRLRAIRNVARAGNRDG